MPASLLLTTALTLGLERVDVNAGGASTHVEGPPTAATILKMSGAELGASMAKWATEELEDKALLFMRVSMLGNGADGIQETDDFVAVAGALPALIQAATMHTCGEQSVGKRGVPTGLIPAMSVNVRCQWDPFRRRLT